MMKNRFFLFIATFHETELGPNVLNILANSLSQPGKIFAGKSFISDCAQIFFFGKSN